jgi:hypothetical protein
LSFNSSLKVDFQGSQVTSDGGLILVRELDEAVHIAEYERKIAELERKVGQLTMEVDLLKKGAQLGRQPNDGSYSIVSGPKPSPLPVERCAGSSETVSQQGPGHLTSNRIRHSLPESEPPSPRNLRTASEYSRIRAANQESSFTVLSLFGIRIVT